ncbi:hypothetical protein FO519_000738 [Halicephalobus sp. NKZ332]|nr:hypothetical protein FO519_000738 [Halicephalobus sp. NKZ332]
MQLNFSTYEAALALQTSLNQQLGALKKPSSVLSTLIFVKLRRSFPIQWYKRLLYCIHAFLLIILSFLFIASTVYDASRFLFTQVTGVRLALIIFRLHANFCFACLFFWYFNSGDIKLKEYILNSSNGIGIVKEQRKLRSCNWLAIIYGSLRIALYLFFHGVIYYLPEIRNQEYKIDKEVAMRIIAPSIILILQFFAVPVFYSICVYPLLSLAAEFRAIVGDFNNDENVYQLPVVRHYLYAHFQILQVFIKFRSFFSHAISGFIVCAFVSSFSILIGPSETTDTESQIYKVLRIVIFIENIGLIFILGQIGITIKEAIMEFAEQLMLLLASNRVLQEEVNSFS